MLANVSTMAVVFWLVALLAPVSHAQETIPTVFEFNYANETLTVPMIPRTDSGAVEPEYLKLYQSMSAEQRRDLFKRRELKLQLYTFLLSKIKLGKLTNSVDYVMDRWSGPVEIPNVADWWDGTSKRWIDLLLAKLDRHFWNNMQTELDGRLATSRGIHLGVGIGKGVGPWRFVQMIGINIGVRAPRTADEKPHFFITFETERAHPDLAVSGLAFLGIRANFWHNRDQVSAEARHLRTQGYFIGSPFSFGRQRTRNIPGDSTLPASSLSVGFNNNYIWSWLASTTFSAGATGHYGTAAAAGAAWYLVNFLSSINGVVTIKDTYRVGPTENTSRWIRAPINAISNAADSAAVFVEPVFGFVGEKYENSLVWGRTITKRFLTGTLVSSKKQCAAMILYR